MSVLDLSCTFPTHKPKIKKKKKLMDDPQLDRVLAHKLLAWN